MQAPRQKQKADLLLFFRFRFALTKNFFAKVKVFHVGKKKNGHFIFVDVNNHNNWLETSTGEITENSNIYKRIVTRNSVINIIKIS